MYLICCMHRWFSGRMLACHAGGPGSIPGRCNSFLCVKKINIKQIGSYLLPMEEHLDLNIYNFWRLLTLKKIIRKFAKTILLCWWSLGSIFRLFSNLVPNGKLSTSTYLNVLVKISVYTMVSHLSAILRNIIQKNMVYDWATGILSNSIHLENYVTVDLIPL